MLSASFCSFNILARKWHHDRSHEGMWGVTLLSESESLTISLAIPSRVQRKTALCNKWLIPIHAHTNNKSYPLLHPYYVPRFQLGALHNDSWYRWQLESIRCFSCIRLYRHYHIRPLELCEDGANHHPNFINEQPQNWVTCPDSRGSWAEIWTQASLSPQLTTVCICLFVCHLESLLPPQGTL